MTSHEIRKLDFQSQCSLAIILAFMTDCFPFFAGRHYLQKVFAVMAEFPSADSFAHASPRMPVARARVCACDPGFGEPPSPAKRRRCILQLGPCHPGFANKDA